MDGRFRRRLVAMTRSRNLTFSPSALAQAKAWPTAAALAPADVSALAGAKVAPVVATAAVDELVPVRVMSSLLPDSYRGPTGC
jgi:hypothetical protein